LKVSNAQLKKSSLFSDENKKTIKFIPDSKEIFQRTYKLIIMFLSVLSLKKTVLNDPTIKIFKRYLILFFEYCYNRSIVLADATFGDFDKTRIKGPVFF
jgi:putative colanic acid biosynthesis UDP-glucose lipid carrier transferase